MLFIILTDDRQIIVFPDLFKNTRNISFPIKFGAILSYNSFCIPESFDANISHQLFDYKITFIIREHKFKNRFETFILKISGGNKKNPTQIQYDELI